MVEPSTRASSGVPWAVALGALVLLVYWPVGSFGFVAYDDGQYVTDNPVVQRGLSWAGVKWAFTTLHAANWHPLTWLSLMADVSLFGVDAGWLHRSNAFWHLLNACLLWLFLERLTGARWRSWLVAALFAVLPVHVESVAWISERKDVLSTFFWLLASAAWLGYVRHGTRGRYAAVVAAFTLGLLSKPMVVTLPVVLLLLDFWPLRRFAEERAPWARWRPLVLEKVPLFALTAASSAITIAAQHRGGATATAEGVPYIARFGNAFLAAATYLWKMVWPANLAVFYPNPAASVGGVPVARTLVAAGLLLGLTAVAIWQRRRRPYLLFGWLWYAVTLLPVIGILQVGRQGMADRYTYLPLIGVSVALVWLIPMSWVATHRRRLALTAGLGGLVLALATAARVQAGHWRDSFTLFQHAAEVTDGNWLAWKNLGTIHHERGQYHLALAAFRKAAAALPDDPDIWFDLGVEHAMLDEHAAAAECFRRSVVLEPGDREAWFRLGVSRALLRQNDSAAEAIERLRELDAAKAMELEKLVDRIARQLSGS